MATDRRGLFSAEEEVQFAAEVVAKRKDLRAVGQALGRSTGDCVLYYYAHFKQGRRGEYERLKRAMHGWDMGDDMSEIDDNQDDDDDGEGRAVAEDPPSPSIVAQRLSTSSSSAKRKRGEGWSADEDQFIRQWVRQNGAQRWGDAAAALAFATGKPQRTHKACRQRW